MTWPLCRGRRLRHRVAAGTPALLLSLFGLSLLLSTVAQAEDLESDAVYVPAEDARTLTVRNALGTVRVQGWDRSEVRVISHRRAATPSARERLRVRVDFGDGRVRVTTGFYLSDGTFNALPLSGAAIDLVIDAPRRLALALATFRGDIDATGFRAGAHLSSQQGHIRVADLEGPVDTRALDGNQWFEAIRGSVAASGADGDMDLADIRGERVDATVFRGRITARDVDAQLVRLHTTVGTVVFIGALRPAAAYDLASGDGDVRMLLREAPFRVNAHASSLRSRIPLLREGPAAWRHVALTRPGPGPAPALARLDLVSLHGAIELSPAP